MLHRLWNKNTRMLNLSLFTVLFMLCGHSLFGASPDQYLVLGVIASSKDQQPTSQYYHLVYGGNISLENDSRTFSARYQFVERPRFESAGFADQESLQTLLFGGKVKDLWKTIQIQTFVGAGQVRGYLKPTSDQNKELYERRGYLINGLALELNLAANFKRIRLAFSHQTIVGISSQSEMKSYVAWPYALYNVSIGCVL